MKKDFIGSPSCHLCKSVLIFWLNWWRKEPLWQKTTCSILEKRENRNLISCTHKISNYGNQIKLSAWTKYIVNTRQYYLVSFGLWNYKVGSSKLLTYRIDTEHSSAVYHVIYCCAEWQVKAKFLHFYLITIFCVEIQIHQSVFEFEIVYLF